MLGGRLQKCRGAPIQCGISPRHGRRHGSRHKERPARMIQLPIARSRAGARATLPVMAPILRTTTAKPIGCAPMGRQISGAFTKACESAGLDPKEVHAHVLRHTMGTCFTPEQRIRRAARSRRLRQGGIWRSAYRKIAPADLGSRLRRRGWISRCLGERAEAQICGSRAPQAPGCA